jgi:hypothetical protein
MHRKEGRGRGHQGSSEQMAKPPGLFRLHFGRGGGHAKERQGEKRSGKRHGHSHQPEPHGPEGCQQVPYCQAECHPCEAGGLRRPVGVVLAPWSSGVPAGTNGLIDRLLAGSVRMLPFVLSHSSKPHIRWTAPAPADAGGFAG